MSKEWSIKIEDHVVKSVTYGGEDFPVSELLLSANAKAPLTLLMRCHPNNVSISGTLPRIMCPRCKVFMERLAYGDVYHYVGCQCELDHEA